MCCLCLVPRKQVKREELFIQCKLWNANHRREHVRADLLASLADLRLEYVDCFLIHWPQACPSAGKAPALCKDGPHPGMPSWPSDAMIPSHCLAPLGSGFCCVYQNGF